MKNLKLGLLASGLVALLGCFLPFIPMDGGPSFFSLNGMEGFANKPYLFMGGAILAIAMAGVAVARGGMRRWMAGVATLGVAASWLATEFQVFELFQLGIGAKLMAVGAIGGLALAIACLVKPEAAAARAPLMPSQAG